MKTLPKAPGLDNTFKFLADPYRFICRMGARLDTDIFQTRLLGKPAICILGADAAQIFFDPELVNRKIIHPTIPDLSDEKASALLGLFNNALRYYSDKWALRPEIKLFEEMQLLMTEVICAWVGVPLRHGDVQKRMRELTRWWSRQRAENWISSLVREEREGHGTFAPLSLAYQIARRTNLSGEYLSVQEVTEEILSILRPAVALSLNVVFIVHALATHPEFREGLRARPMYYWFSKEVLRFYPFSTAEMGMTLQEFELHGYKIPEGVRLVFDIYGTHQDARIFDNPEQFRATRFADPNVKLLPHLAGEEATLLLMCAAVDFFANQLEYMVPEQDLSVDYSRIPAIPKSRMILKVLRRAPAVAGEPVEFMHLE